jgi:putative transcriptional regulator
VAVVLHSGDFRRPESRPIGDHFAVTPVATVLEALAAGTGPRDAILALGYSGWAPGQLENELARDAWIVVPATPDLVFHSDEAGKWRRALDRQGVDL